MMPKGPPKISPRQEVWVKEQALETKKRKGTLAAIKGGHVCSCESILGKWSSAKFRSNKIASHSDVEFPFVKASLRMWQRRFADMADKTASFVMFVQGHVRRIKGMPFSIEFATRRAREVLQIHTARAYAEFVIAVELAHVLALIFNVRSHRQGIAATNTRQILSNTAQKLRRSLRSRYVRVGAFLQTLRSLFFLKPLLR